MHPSPSQTAAREEVKRLLNQLKLQLNERARRRAAGRAEWFSQVGKPLQSDELFTAWPFSVSELILFLPLVSMASHISFGLQNGRLCSGAISAAE
jgi:hypothetical protein